jgi:hypothetical protein
VLLQRLLCPCTFFLETIGLGFDGEVKYRNLPGVRTAQEPTSQFFSLAFSSYEPQITHSQQSVIASRPPKLIVGFSLA